MEQNKPNWWLLYLIVPLMIGSLLLEARQPDSEIMHRLLELGIVLAGFGLMGLWVRANEEALQNEEIGKEPWVLTPSQGDASPCDADSSPADECSGDQTNDGEEFSPTHDTVVDPDILPLVKVLDDSPDNPYHLEASPNKGRYN